VLLEAGHTLQRLLARYMEGVELDCATTVEQARATLSSSPAQALLVNSPRVFSDQEVPALMRELSDLPFDTPAIACWVPGREDAARRMGVTGYLVKPVSGEALLAALLALGPGIRTVLIVDDEPDLLKLFSRIVAGAGADSGRGYRVLRASCGQEALDCLRERRPDAMLLDLIMEGKDGFEVLQEKRGDPAIRDIPVLVVSSRDPANDVVVANRLLISRRSGWSARDLLSMIGGVSDLLGPATPMRPGLPAEPAE
jgi:CheY-like chemotaxis protein